MGSGVVDVPGGTLRADNWGVSGPAVVLLHAGICDRRSWYDVAERLADAARVCAYDRRGFGDATASTDSTFRHVDDLLAVLDVVTDGTPAWLVGSSAGGGVALDAALLHPSRVAGLILLAPAVSGAPEPDSLDPDTERIATAIDAAMDDSDAAELNRLEAWLWLDGPSAVEGRVGGAARALLLEMNANVIAKAARETDGDAGIAAWDRLHEVAVPTTIVCGDLDLPLLVDRCRVLADTIPGSRSVFLPGLAHLPYLEDPQRIAEIVAGAIGVAAG